MQTSSCGRENDPARGNQKFSHSLHKARSAIAVQFDSLKQREDAFSQEAKRLQNATEQSKLRTSQLAAHSNDLQRRSETIETDRRQFDATCSERSAVLAKEEEDLNGQLNALEIELQAIAQNPAHSSSALLRDRVDELWRLDSSLTNERQKVQHRLDVLNVEKLPRDIPTLESDIAIGQQEVEVMRQLVAEKQLTIATLKGKFNLLLKEATQGRQRAEVLKRKLFLDKEKVSVSEVTIQAQAIALTKSCAQQNQKSEMLKMLINKAEQAIPKLTQKIENVSAKLSETRDTVARLRLELDLQFSQKRDFSEKAIQKRADLQYIKTRYGRGAVKWNLDLQQLRNKRQKTNRSLAKMAIAAQIQADRESNLLKKLRTYTELIEKADAAEPYLEKAERTAQNSFRKTDELQKLNEGVALLESLYQEIADKRILAEVTCHPEPQAAQQRPNRQAKRLIRAAKARIAQLKAQIANETQKLETMRRDKVSIENDHHQTQGIIQFLNVKRQLSKNERQLQSCQVANRFHRNIAYMDHEVRRRRDDVTNRNTQN
jgi:hypothetical protein